MSAPILQTREVGKYFSTPTRFKVLTDISFEVQRGEFLTLVGKSGCGKSTLLYLLSTMDTDYEGDIFIDGVKLRDQSRDELARLRNEKIGFVFQFHYLLPEFTVLQNVMIPALKLNRYKPSQVEERAMEKLRLLDIAELSHKMASKLSGGQQQRVAIARALINDPLIIMGDEPTGNLDSRNSEAVQAIFSKLAREQHQTIIAVTHDSDFAKRSDRTIEMMDGRIVSHQKEW